MQILDGKSLAKKIENEVHQEVDAFKSHYKRAPGLAVILVGNDPASLAYVEMKRKACTRTKIYSIMHEFPEETTNDTIINTIKMMNANPNIDGILVQLPLPAHISTNDILEVIDPNKDVDGFHPYNVGKLAIGLDCFVPCTPIGVMELLKEYNINLKGKNCCVVGASNIVGKPLASLLLNANATVEVCHIFTDDLKKHTLNADIILIGTGVINLIKEEMVKEGAIIIDIGINRNAEGKLVGDVDFEHVSSKCSYITPVPGGVGPMTISMLLSNTIKAAKANAAALDQA